MAYWNFGNPLNETELANARQWATGKTWGDIQGKAGELGASADQLGSVFGATGQQAAQYGYGQQPGTEGYGQFDKFTYQPGDWASPDTGGSGGGGTQGNPYLDAMAANITKQYTNNLNSNILPGVRYGAQAAGGFGGSRQGLAEGKAITGSNEALAGALTNLYGTDYTNQQNRDLQKYGIDTQAATSRYGTDKSYDLGLRQAENQLLGINNQYDLGLKGDATQRYGYDTNAATSRYASDNSLQGQLAGAAASQANAAANLSLGQQRLGFDMQQYNDKADWLPLQYGTDILSKFSGLNNTATSTQMADQIANMIGGGITGAQLMKLLG